MEKQKQKNIGTKSMSMKSRAFNKISRYFNSKDELSKTSDEEILKAIEEFILESRLELRNYKDKRRSKAKIQKLREERGYVPKKKTSLAEWIKMQNQFEQIEHPLDLANII